MSKIDIKQLMDNYLEEHATPEERAEAHRFGDFLTRQADLEGTLRELKAKYQYQLNIAPEQVRARRRKLRLAAALAAILLGANIIYFTREGSRSTTEAPLIAALPGVRVQGGATLKLSNGEVIPLASAPIGEVYSSKSIKITKADSGSLVYTVLNSSPQQGGQHRLEVRDGSEYNVTFSDGSKALVGPGSTITYSPQFTDAHRLVELEGLAEFHVVKNAARGFKVVIRNQEIKVLGTHFNVSSYRGETEITTLLQGAVAVSSLKGAKQTEILRPGQQALSDGSGLEVQTLDSMYLSNLSKGYLVFYNTPLKDVLRQVSRWYNIEVDYGNISNISINATLFFKLPLTDMLDILNQIPGVKLVQKDDIITTL